MRILILDDNPARHEIFAVRYAGNEIVSCYTYRGFLSALESTRFDLIHLDHDLGDFDPADTYVDGWGKTREYNGGHAAMRVCELAEGRRPGRVVIQSVNPVGAWQMLAMLQRAGVDVVWQPFGETAETTATIA